MGEYDTESNPDCIEYEDDKDCNDPPFDSNVTSRFFKINKIIANNEIFLGVLIHPKRTNSSKEFDIAIIIMDTKPPFTGKFTS